MGFVARIASASSAVGGRVATVLVVVCAALATWSPAASAATDHFFSGTLPAGFGFEGTQAHPSVTYIQGTGSRNGFCIAKDNIGPTEWDFAGRYVSGARTCATSGGFAARYEIGTCCFRPWIDNQTTADITIDPWTTYVSY